MQEPYTILNPEITALKLTHICTSHFALAEVDCAGSSLYIASGYFQLSHPIEDHLNNLANVLNEIRGKNVIICLDSKAISPLWGSTKTDSSGEALKNLIAQYNLCIANKANRLATVSSENGEGNVDVTLISPALERKIHDWTVRDGWTSSDQRVITMQVNRIENTDENSSTSRTRGGYVTSKANWEVFIEVLKKEWNEVPKNMPGSKMQCIERVKDLTRAMRKACNTAIPSRN